MENQFTISKKQLKLFVLLVVIKILYEVCICIMLPERYLLWSFEKNINWDYLVWELPIFLLISLYYCQRYDDISSYSYITTLLFLFYFIPTNSALVLSGVDAGYYALSNLFAGLLIIVFASSAQKEKRLTEEALCSYGIDEEELFIDNVLSSPKLWWVAKLFCILVCALTIVNVYLYNGLNFAGIFNEMYSVRAQYASHASDITGSLSSYLTLIITGLGGWFLPLYLYFSIKKGSILDIILSIFTIVANFTIEMQKSSLMIVLIVFGIIWLEKRNKLSTISDTVIKAFLLMLLLALIEFIIRGDSFLFTVFIRRMLYIPAYMNQKYYDFFSINKKIFFTQDAFLIQNILQKLFGRAYTQSSVAVISMECFGGQLPSPNTGLFAEAYSQMGIFGLLVFPFLYRYITKKVIKLSSVYGRGATYIVGFRFVLVMTSVFVLTSSTFIGILLFIGLTFLIQMLVNSHH